VEGLGFIEASHLTSLAIGLDYFVAEIDWSRLADSTLRIAAYNNPSERNSGCEVLAIDALQSFLHGYTLAKSMPGLWDKMRWI
jgi:hypothetical protein